MKCRSRSHSPRHKPPEHSVGDHCGDDYPSRCARSTRLVEALHDVAQSQRFEAAEFLTISKLDPEGDGPGYQRVLNESRAKRLAQYLLDGQAEQDAFLPTSVFLATNNDIPFDPQTNTIAFDVSQIGPFNVVDGQHRIAGLVWPLTKTPIF